MEIPVVRRTLSIRSPYAVLVKETLLPLPVGVFVLGFIFQFWPEALDHNPIAFEPRGLVHHLWHYLLWASSGLVLVAMFKATDKWRIGIETWAWGAMLSSLSLNVVYRVAGTINPPSGEQEPSGLGTTGLLILVLMVMIRVWILVFRPKAPIDTQITDGT